MSIAILGWGSLLWEGGGQFDRQHEQWQGGGPVLKIEFSRISESRLGALTLVIDDQFGAPMQVAWCLSKRQTIEDAICDLRSREGTTVENIGHVRMHAERPPLADLLTPQDVIAGWAKPQNLDAVIYTALKSNFQERKGQPFSVDAAVAHVRAMNPTAKARAAEYVWRAPDFVRTPLRSALQREPWFLEGEPPA
jgi:hypothetical protein